MRDSGYHGKYWKDKRWERLSPSGNFFLCITQSIIDFLWQTFQHASTENYDNPH